VFALFQKSLKALAKLQVEGAKGLDYTYCLTSKEFGKHAILTDLLYYKYYFFRGDARWQVSKLEYEKLYLYAVLSKYRMKIPTIVKIVERIRGYRHG
jgi:hypothetical protein